MSSSNNERSDSVRDLYNFESDINELRYNYLTKAVDKESSDEDASRVNAAVHRLVAISKRQKRKYKIILNNVEYCVKTCATVYRNHRGETPLHIACKKSNEKAVRIIIENDLLDINQKDYAGWTPLHEAVESGCKGAVKLLLDAGALPNVPGYEYTGPLVKAYRKADADISWLLIQYGAFMYMREDENKKLLEFGDNPNLGRKLCLDHFLCPVKTVYIPARCQIYLTKNVPAECKKKLQDFSSTVCSFNNGVTHVVADELDFTSLEVLVTVLKGGIIYTKEWIDKYPQTFSLPIYVDLIPKTYRCFEVALENRLANRPSLFHGLKFHVMKHSTPITLHGTNFGTDDLLNVIKSGGGEILKREPHLTTVENYTNEAYHLRGTPLEGCRCVIVYDGRVDLKLKYSMDVLKHQTSQWLINFVLNFGLQ